MAKYNLEPEQFFNSNCRTQVKADAVNEAVHRLRDELGYETGTIVACLGMHYNTVCWHLRNRRYD